jgi:hypothetical protein
MGQASIVSLVALFASAGAPAEAGPHAFSADIVSVNGNGRPLGATARLRAADNKARIEIEGAPDGFFLSDSGAGTALYVRFAQRLYMDARQSTPLTQIFVWVDPHDPCRQWQMAAATAGVMNTGEWRCELIERQSVDRHEVSQYRVMMPDRAPSYGWVDTTIGFPLKWQAADGKVFELKNVQLRAQPASLFSIPSGYRKLDPQALLERIKHSDVWADSSK